MVEAFDGKIKDIPQCVLSHFGPKRTSACIVHTYENIYVYSCRHMILGTTAFYLVSNNHFPALKEAIYRAEKKIDPDWDGVKIQLAILMSKMDAAKEHVEDVTKV